MTHTSTELPEALMRLADNYAEACFDQGLNQRTTDDKPETEREKLEKAIRRMHTRIAELEAQLSAIGAGGVEPLRKPVAAPLVPQGWKPVQIELLERIQESLGSFLSDQGWSQSDMDTADALGGLLAAATQPAAQGMDAQTLKHISALSELVRMPNAEHFSDAHNAAVRHLRSLAAQAKQGGAA